MKNNENFEHCKRIANMLEAIVNGDVMRCPECGEYVNVNDWEDFDLEDGGFLRLCGECHQKSDGEEWDDVTLYDYFEEVFDVEYRIGADKEYRSIRLMVACGGPNIYIDTGRKLVELHWWRDYAEYPLASEICDEIDAMWEEMFNN